MALLGCVTRLTHGLPDLRLIAERHIWQAAYVGTTKDVASGECWRVLHLCLRQWGVPTSQQYYSKEA